MTKEEVREIVADMFRNDEITIYIDQNKQGLNDIKTKVEVYVGGECVQSSESIITID